MTGTVRAWHPGVVLPSVDLSPEIIAAIKAALGPEQVVALTAWAEARSRLTSKGWVANPVEAMADIVNVIDNRVHDPRWRALGHAGVCFQRWQFSCWEPRGGPDSNHDPRRLADNFEALMDRAQRMMAGERTSATLLDCHAIAYGCLFGSMSDTLRGATHYYAPASMVPAGAMPPWAAGATLTAERYGHRFYAAVR